MKIEYEILDQSQCEWIHAASLQVLEKTGMRIHDDELCQALKYAGLSVDPNGRVTFPAAAIAAAIQAAPGAFQMSDRLGNLIAIESGNTLPAVYANAIKIWDYAVSPVKPPTRRSVHHS